MKHLLILFLSLSACASDNDIFPAIPLSLSTSTLQLPNPIDFATDPANSQIIVVNSNVDLAYGQSSLVSISVDATDPTAIKLAATDAIEIPNFAGEIAFDGTNAFIPFREASSSNDAKDQLHKYTIGAGALAEAKGTTISENPFGIAVNGSDVLVVANDKLEYYNTNLSKIKSIDLTTASDANIDNAHADSAESVAIDATTNRAFISNRSDNIFVVDLTDKVLTHVIDGPQTTRGIASDGTYVYVVSGYSSALWVINPANLSTPTDSPQKIDDAKVFIATIPLGSNPNGLAIDANNHRAYVTNTDDNTVSVIDLLTLKEVAQISLDNDDTGLDDVKDPFGIAVDTFDGTPLIFVGGFTSNNFAVINGNTLKVEKVFPWNFSL